MTVCSKCGHDLVDHSGPGRECRWEQGVLACRCRVFTERPTS